MTGLLSSSSADESSPASAPLPDSTWKKIFPDYARYTAAGTLLLYLCGYLSLRTEITTLGIPAEFGTLDERYIFAGASFVVYLVFSIAQLALAAGVIGTLIWVGALIVCKRRASWCASGMTVIDTVVQRVPGWIPLILSAATSLLTVRSIVPVIGVRNLIFAERVPDGLTAFIGTGADLTAHAIFVRYLVALLAATGLWVIATTLWNARTRWLVPVAVAIAVQLLTLPMLYGLMRADTPRPVVSFGREQHMFLIWEEGDTLIFVTHQKPFQVIRKQKSSLPELTIVGVGSIFEAGKGTE